MNYGENTTTKLQKENTRLLALLDQKKAEIETVRSQWDRNERRLRSVKGVVTRIKNRTARGVCPCCEATFPDLELHMKEHHPEFETKPEEGAEE